MSPRSTKTATRWSYNGYIAARLFDTFEEVFGAAASQRLVKVVSGQQVSSGVLGGILEVMANPRFNPSGVKADAVSITMYFSGSNAPVSDLTTHKNLGAQYGINKIVAYEGGDGRATNGGSVYANYTSVLNALAGAGLDLFNQYTLVGAWSESGGDSWGAKDHTTQDMNAAPKYKALYDYQSQHGNYNAAENYVIPESTMPAVSVGTIRGDGRFRLRNGRQPVRFQNAGAITVVNPMGRAMLADPAPHAPGLHLYRLTENGAEYAGRRPVY